MTHRATLRALALTGFLASLAPAAFAAEPADVGVRLKAMLAEQGTSIDWSGIVGDASKATLQGVTVGIAGQPAKVAIGDVQMTGITEEEGEITVGSIVVPAYTFSEAGSAIEMSGLTITNLYLPAADDTGPLADLMLYDSADVGSVAVNIEGKQAFAVNDIHIELGLPDDENGALDFEVAAEKFTADLTLAQDPKTKAIIDQLGYQTLNGFLQASGSWKPSDGRMLVDQYDLSIENAGTLGMTFDIAGYTPAFMESLREMQKKMAENPSGDQSAQGIAMLGLMQQITFGAATIRFEDDSLTAKVLDLVAKQQGVQPADIVNQVKAILPFGLAQLNNPALATNVSAAVNKFLDDPKSLEIKAAPGSALPVAQIVAAATTAPQTLPQVLGVTVTANEQ